jgi:hypothetical protein
MNPPAVDSRAVQAAAADATPPRKLLIGLIGAGIGLSLTPAMWRRKPGGKACGCTTS